MITFEQSEDDVIYIDYGDDCIGWIQKHRWGYILKWDDSHEQICYTLQDAKDIALLDYRNHLPD